jgi:hypothetical protein
MNTFYEYVDFPKVPEELLEDPEVIFKKPPLKLNRHLDSPDNPAERKHWPVAISDPLYTWLKDNIFKEEILVWYTVSSGELEAHKDMRQYCYNYILVTGGDDVVTYKKQNDKIVEYVKFEPKRWLKLDNHVLHGTFGEFKNGPRILLQITPIESYSHLDRDVFQRSIGYKTV